MKLTVMERLGNFVSGGAVVKWKLEAMQWETTSNHWKKMALNETTALNNSMDRLFETTEALRNISEMGTPNMAHIGKKMQAEAQQEEMRHLDEPFNVVSAFK